MTLLRFVIGALLLAWEGSLLAGLVLGSKRERALRWSLGFPLGALLNALLFFLLHLAGLGLRTVPVAVAHGALLLFLWWFHGRLPERASMQPPPPRIHSMTQRVLIACCAVSVGIVAANSAVYAILLPTSTWDSFTSWAMRAQQSWAAGRFILDGTVQQPQYPILLHALQILPMADAWSDRAARTMLFLLSVSAFGGIFALARRAAGTLAAWIALFLITSVPLGVIHLRQGYADIHVVEFALLGALLLHLALRERSRRLLLLSAIAVGAAAWTKFDGLGFAALPWAVVALACGWKARWVKPILLVGIVPLLALVVPWPAYVSLLGLTPTPVPHARGIALHLALFPQILEQVFALGSFGLHWWAIACAAAVVVWQRRRNLAGFLASQPVLAWSILTSLLVVFVYLCTEVYVGLVNRDDFSRVVLLPTALLCLGFTLAFSENPAER